MARIIKGFSESGSEASIILTHVKGPFYQDSTGRLVQVDDCVHGLRVTDESSDDHLDSTVYTILNRGHWA